MRFRTLDDMPKILKIFFEYIAKKHDMLYEQLFEYDKEKNIIKMVNKHIGTDFKWNAEFYNEKHNLFFGFEYRLLDSLYETSIRSFLYLVYILAEYVNGKLNSKFINYYEKYFNGDQIDEFVKLMVDISKYGSKAIIPEFYLVAIEDALKIKIGNDKKITCYDALNSVYQQICSFLC